MVFKNLIKRVQDLQKKSTAVGSVPPHSHDSSRDSAEPMEPIVKPDNITGNLNNNQKLQNKGKALWQGQQMADQIAQRQMDEPVRPPGNSTTDEYGDMFTQPFNKKEPKYKRVNVQDLEDMGRVKSDKKGKYVVNSDEMKTGSSKDTLRFPRGAKHYTGRDYKVGEMIDETDFENFAKDVNKT